MEFIKSSENKNNKIIFGVLPLGSGCDFVRTYGLKAEEIEKNLDILFQCFTIPCDVGLCNSTSTNTNNNNNNNVSRYYLNSSSVGASGAIMKAVNSSSLIISHEFTYTYHTLMTSLFTPNSIIKYKNSEKSEYRQGKFYMMTVVNGQFFGNNCWLNPYGRIEDGKLDVVLMGDLSFREILTAFSSIKTGDHLTVPKVSQEPSTEVFFAIPGEGHVDEILIECDGELSGKLPASWKVEKRPIHLVVPEKFQYKNK